MSRVTDPVALGRASGARMPELDGLRGLAIAMVLVYHFFVGQVYPPRGTFLAGVKRLCDLTWSGVDLFFVLSGFLLGGILLDNRGKRNYFKAFYARRACRILPLYTAVVLAYFVARALVSGTWRATPFAYLLEPALPAWSYLTFTQNFVMAAREAFGAHWLAVTWSLAIEEHFYIFLPLFLSIVPVRRVPVIILVLVAGVMALRAVVYANAGTWISSYVLTPCRVDGLLLGVLGAWCMREPRVRQALEQHVSALRLAVVALAVACLATVLTMSQTVGSCVVAYGGFTALALFYTALMIWILLDSKTWVNRLFRTPVLRFLGVISYGVYMVHDVVSGLLHGAIHGSGPVIRGLPQAGTTLLALALTVALASFSWFMIERRLVALGRRVQFG